MELFRSLTFTVLCTLATCSLQEDEDLQYKISDIFENPNQNHELQPPLQHGSYATLPPTRVDCKCVPVSWCQKHSIVTEENCNIDLRSHTANQRETNVCCKNPLPLNQKIPATTIHPTGCGRRNTDGIRERTSGTQSKAKFGEAPWMVSVLRLETLLDGAKLHMYVCGGALIHEHVVLTAAHCVVKNDSRPLKVRAGEWDIETTLETFPHQDRSVVRMIPHEKYLNSDYLHNDVALLITEVPFEITEHVNIICLPKQDEVILDRNCFATGWGKDAFGEKGQYQLVLKKVHLPMVERSECQNKLRRTKLGPGFNLHESFVCAGGEIYKDTCKGDGGSPLVCPIPGKKDHYQQAGMVSWGIGCGSEIPAVYVNTAKFRNWIDDQMNKLAYIPEY